jgi:uncharacterized protein with HEPN domain
MWKDDAYLLDMLLYAERARKFCKDATRDSFLIDEELQMATMYALQVVGEAASKVSAEFRTTHPEIPWPRVVNLRHRLVHDYPGIEMPKVWDIVQDSLPQLVQALTPLVPRKEQ